MATLRGFLDDSRFDWATGKLIIQEAEENKWPGWDDQISSKLIKNQDPILEEEFDDGFGSPQCPRYIAEDSRALYFPEQYDGSTSPCMVFKDITKYLDINNPTPYPGG